MAVCVYGYMHSQLYVLYLRRYAFTAVCIHGCMHSSLYALMAVCTYGCMHSRLYAFTGEHIQLYVFMGVLRNGNVLTPLCRRGHQVPHAGHQWGLLWQSDTGTKEWNYQLMEEWEFEKLTVLTSLM